MKVITLLLISKLVFANSVIAVLDNQIDTTNTLLNEHVWQNQNESQNQIDDDNNGYIDDLNGWNFIDNSNKLFNFDLYGSYPDIVYKYYEIKAKKSLGTITETELEWYNNTRKDEEFKKKKEGFTSFIHGTHISCLAANFKNLPSELQSNDIKFLPVRYLGEASNGAFKKPEFKALEQGSESEKIAHIESYISKYTKWMIGKLELTIDYVKGKAQVINGSWGQGYGTTVKVVNELFDTQFEDSTHLETTKEEIAKKFIKNLVGKGTLLLRSHPEILFVFSAGNKKEDTDIDLHYPSSIILPNVISVAASDNKDDKAYFSNFGKNTVTLFAPGLAVKSCTPDNRELPVNGTSQAAPQVSNVAIKLFALAKKLGKEVTPRTVKDILINSSTKSSKLKDLCVSSGILNEQRALNTLRQDYFLK